MIIKIVKQKGFLLVSAVILLTVIALLVSATAYNVITQTLGSQGRLLGAQALYIAEAGLTAASTAVIQGNVACAAVTGLPLVTQVNFGVGQMTATATNYTPSPLASLSNTVSAISTVIPVSSLTGYAPRGRVLLDEEEIDYTGTSSSAVTCGTAPCLTGILRGQQETTASAHIIGTSVYQKQCTIESNSAVPTIISPQAQRRLSQAVVGMREAWAFGNNASGEMIGYFNGHSWSQWPVSASIPNENFNGVSMANAVDGWAVGVRNGGSATLLHWNGSMWSRWLPAPSQPALPNVNLFGVHCRASNDCWAVGASRTFLHWDGSQWNSANVGSALSESTNANGVFCSNANDCWAVCDRQGVNIVLARWNGSLWNRVVLVGGINLNSVTCVQDNECWAVGDNRLFLRWNGSSWTSVVPQASVPSVSMNGVTCNTSADCWAVGDRHSGNASLIHWNGSAWSRVLPDSSVANQNLNAVSCEDAAHCFAVGNSGSIARWNGAVWQDVTMSVSFSTLNAVATFHGILPQLQGWRTT